jgi:hypothetical protein
MRKTDRPQSPRIVWPGPRSSWYSVSRYVAHEGLQLDCRSGVRQLFRRAWVHAAPSLSVSCTGCSDNTTLSIRQGSRPRNDDLADEISAGGRDTRKRLLSSHVRKTPRPPHRCRGFAGEDHSQVGRVAPSEGRPKDASAASALTVILRGERMPGAEDGLAISRGTGSRGSVATATAYLRERGADRRQRRAAAGSRPEWRSRHIAASLMIQGGTRRSGSR